MGHAAIDNRTPYALSAIHRADEDGRPLLVTLIRATFTLGEGGLSLARDQAPAPIEGVLHGADPATSSWRFEPEIAFVKPATDVVLLGHAHAPAAGAPCVDVSLRVGPVARSARVTGDRVWIKSLGGIVMSRPAPFERIPLLWERAFGGADRTAGAPDRPSFEITNPVGTGFRGPGGRFEEEIRLPNLESPDEPITRFGQAVRPVGFGVVSPNWHPRAALAGTYDEAWRRERRPRMPRDFDRRFFNAAAPGLVAPGYLRGDEPVTVLGASPEGALSFRLPGAPRPRVRVELKGRRDVPVETQLDTVVIDVDDRVVLLTYRGFTALRDGPHDVKTILAEITGGGPAAAEAR